MARYQLIHPDAFLIRDASGVSYTGGDQRWYAPLKDFWQEAACGATTCSNVISYFAQRDETFAGLCPYDLHTKEGFLELMKRVYPFVRPGRIGIMPKDFIRGITEYTASRGFRFQTTLFTFPAFRSKRPSAETVYSHIRSALSGDLPVAFINLSNGRVRHLDGYHWVTIISLDDERGMITIVDNGRALEVSLAQWIRKTTMGGAFVTAEPEAFF
jgi:hypothetical protein